MDDIKAKYIEGKTLSSHHVEHVLKFDRMYERDYLVLGRYTPKPIKAYLRSQGSSSKHPRCKTRKFALWLTENQPHLAIFCGVAEII